MPGKPPSALTREARRHSDAICSNRVTDFIIRLREIYPDRYAEFSGGCLKFALLLRALFGGQLWYTHGHMIVFIAGHFYDIDGVVTVVDGYMPVEQYGPAHFAKWAEDEPRALEVFGS